MKKNKTQVYTDGACKGNPGIGGWGVLVLNTEKNYELKGCELNTTNNRMELIAVINGLKSIKKSTDIDLLTDSKYVKNGINDWIFNWKKNGWRTASKKPVKNRDLWQELDQLVQNYNINWQWVKGHSGNIGNERADELANEAIFEYQDNSSSLGD